MLFFWDFDPPFQLLREVLIFVAAFAQVSLVEKENRPPKLSYSFERNTLKSYRFWPQRNHNSSHDYSEIEIFWTRSDGNFGSCGQEISMIHWKKKADRALIFRGAVLFFNLCVTSLGRWLSQHYSLLKSKH